MWPPFIVSRKWRKVPVTLWAKREGGPWRYEADGKPDEASHLPPKEFTKDHPDYYLSRNQYWCESHTQIQWPLFYCTHKYNSPADVLPSGTRGDRDGKIVLFYIGAKRDADKIFWWIAAFLGRNFK